MTENLSLLADAATHVGLVRPGNEDAFLCAPPVFAVADGLGGHAAGEVASAMTVEHLGCFHPDLGKAADELQPSLADVVRAANRAVHDAAQAPERAGMGTTVTAMIIAGGRAGLVHVGDSRAYLLRGGDLHQLTVDHTAAQHAVDAGYLTSEQAAVRPERHLLARAIGLEADVKVDTPQVFDLVAGDQLLLCSDGLTEAVDELAIATILDRHGQPAAACAALVQAALDGGGPDNVTVVVVAVRADGSHA